ncbi:MAG: PorT family protein [Bacteroidales bacterium]|nr:PorT family protein [Bacteroidales bacterium]
MKRPALILFIALFSISAQAQFTFGPKIGFTLNTLSIDQSTITTELNNSFLFGVFARIGKKVYLQPELNWYTSGAVFKRPSIGSLSPFEQEVLLSNIQVPVLLGMKIIDIKAACIRAAIGPSMNIIVDKKIKTLNSSGYMKPIEKSDINTLHWGLNIGAGADVLMFTFDVKVMLGLSSIIDNVDIDNSPVLFDSRSNGFVVSIGWKIL